MNKSEWAYLALSGLCNIYMTVWGGRLMNAGKLPRSAYVPGVLVIWGIYWLCAIIFIFGGD